MPTLTREIHGIDGDTLRGYLTHLGGVEQPDGSIAGPRWRASITRLPDYRIGHAAFCSFLVEIVGEGEALRALEPRFDLRIMRPGG